MSGPDPKPAPKWTQEEIDAQMGFDDDIDEIMGDDEDWPGGVCGRWDNGRLGPSCSLAGTEECDWECPHRNRNFLKAVK